MSGSPSGWRWAAPRPRVSACPTLSRYDTSSVRLLGVGGATVSPTVQQNLREAFPSTSGSLGMGYTSTEAAAVVANIGGPDFQSRPTSTGRVTPTTEIELRDEQGRPVGDGELGEVHVRSPYLMLGYWRDAEATATALKPGGWLAMGDMARLVDGWLYIDARRPGHDPGERRRTSRRPRSSTASTSTPTWWRPRCSPSTTPSPGMPWRGGRRAVGERGHGRGPRGVVS